MHTGNDTDTITSNKCKVRNTMKFTAEATKEVVWMADEHMMHCNLLSMIGQHWSHVHELNRYLIELVRDLAIG